MLQSIIRLSLRYRLVVVLAVAGFALIAAARLPNAHYGVFPTFSPPTVQVQTAATGLDPHETELAVTDQLEQGLGGLTGLATMQSQSSAGLSVVKLVFHGGTNLYLDRERVAGRLSSLTTALPPGSTPAIMPLQSATGTAVDIALDAPGMSLMKLTAITENVVRPALRAVPGVANVVVFGAVPPQLDIEVMPQALIGSGFGLNSVAMAARNASALIGGGFLDTGNQQILLEAHGQTRDAAALGASLLGTKGGTPFTLSDIARVRTAPPPPYGAALIRGRPGLLLIVSSLYGANTLAVAHEAEQAITKLTPALQAQGIHVDPSALAPANFVHEALADLGHVLLIGAGLILVVLILALRNWRIALISFVSIPVSLLVATVFLHAFGITLNVMSLAGLAIALGEVVDDAVVDVENINRRLGENRMLERPAPVLAVIMRASIEVRSAIIFATLSVIVMFAPVLVLGGTAGRLFAPLGIAYVAAILASLVVALTLTPALAAILLGGRRQGAAVPKPIAAAKRIYGRMLNGVERTGLAIGVIALILMVAAAASVPFLRTSFLPGFREQDMIAHYLSAPGTSIHTMLAIGKQASDKLLRLREVGDVVIHVGRASLSNGHPGVNKAEIDITLSQYGNAHTKAAEAKVLATISNVPGLRWWSNTFLAERINETLSGFTEPLVISVYGPKLSAVSADARQIITALHGVPGALAPSLAAPANTPVMSITLKRAAMARYDVTARAVLGVIRAAYAGDEVGRVYAGLLIEPIMVTLPRAMRTDPASLASLPVANAQGRIVPLGMVARIRQTLAPALILHQGGRRVQVVTVQAAPGHSGAVLAAACGQIAKLHLAANDTIAYGGSAVAGNAAQLALLIHAGIALLIVLVLLALALGDGRAVMLMALGLPFALAGGIAAAWLVLGGALSLGAMVGLVTLFGLSLRNGLLLLIHYGRLVRDEGLPWSAETARRGAMDRLPAILITATVTALGLLPLALATGSPGDEIEGPMAIVILGGLITATMVTLLILPHLAARFLRFAPKPDDGIG
jgi:CzcA family heavy metal efflux pump